MDGDSWMLAKMVVQATDYVHSQMVEHLLKASNYLCKKKELILRYRFLPYRDCCFVQCLMGAFLYKITVSVQIEDLKVDNLISSSFVRFVFADLQIAGE